MGVSFSIDNEKIEVLFEGRFSVDDVLKIFNEALNQTSSPLPILVNVTKSEESKREPDLRTFADFLSKNKNKIVPRVAILVAHALRYGTGRQVGAYLETVGIECEPFYDKEEALAWLKRE